MGANHAQYQKKPSHAFGSPLHAVSSPAGVRAKDDQDPVHSKPATQSKSQSEEGTSLRKPFVCQKHCKVISLPYLYFGETSHIFAGTSGCHELR